MSEQDNAQPVERHTISVLVENKPGVLARVSGLFSRRGYNIESLAVSPTEKADVSRMTLVTTGTRQTLEQITKQLYKLIDVIKVYDHTDDPVVERELALIKVRCSKQTRSDILQLIEVFRGNVLDLSQSSIIVEVTGNERKVSAIQRSLNEFGIVELVRTGKIVLVRGQRET